MAKQRVLVRKWDNKLFLWNETMMENQGEKMYTANLIDGVVYDLAGIEKFIYDKDAKASGKSASSKIIDVQDINSLAYVHGLGEEDLRVRVNKCRTKPDVVEFGKTYYPAVVFDPKHTKPQMVDMLAGAHNAMSKPADPTEGDSDGEDFLEGEMRMALEMLNGPEMIHKFLVDFGMEIELDKTTPNEMFDLYIATYKARNGIE